MEEIKINMRGATMHCFEGIGISIFDFIGIFESFYTYFVNWSHSV